ncbi:hypothetical protein ACFWU3_32575 [Streptomyces sp. NPDC058685]|uniref:hypothetical protein n=1 Tax=Streptomyces sp. NPDC058685 TaxID=3346598 RepID=UPI003658745F
MAHPAFPSDLVQAQRDWNRTYAQLAEGVPHCTTLRCRLLRLSVRLLWHPFWETERGRSPAARVELRRQARGLERNLDVPARDRDRPAGDSRRVRDAIR